ncbi:sugar phosphate isomerase/epimerase family protein [Paenibacillus qinlingensis]|uniref:Sugar phosphate isomerase/epimerase n=1 Tax=Paenibacillus qinlingensis TaxID=1837343 RepID=A0ABU1NYF2_9BACL|nr:sugar phosphate isomerase/epimerase family protein [Paenibacillus qinlingensis]MDR6551857.1 sugar phosphate isomerase/epimerase [Paenibacillus qinlingensis]
MRRLACSTLPCEGWKLADIISFAKECGFAAMELREGPAWAVSTEMTLDERLMALQLFEESGIKVTDIGSNVCFNGSDRDQAMSQQFEKVAHLAHDLKAQGIRVFLGYFNNRRDKVVPAIHYEKVVDRIRLACDYAASLQVQVWLETHNEFATGKALRKLLDDVDRPNCAVIYDIIHPLEEGESPEETIALLGDQCAHIHMKDGVPFEDPMEINWTYTKVGEGVVPIVEIIHLLDEAGYQGYFSLEWETKWRKELQVPGMEPELIFPAYVAYMNDLSKLK